jgi:hypothetical protein
LVLVTEQANVPMNVLVIARVTSLSGAYSASRSGTDLMPVGSP